MERNSSGILEVLFICILLNIFPIALLGVFKISSTIYTMLYAFSYCIQTILLILKLNNNIKHLSKRNFGLLVCFFLNNFFALIYSYLYFGSVDYNEYLHIVSSTINILIFVFSLENVNITNNELLIFLKKMLFLGIISVIINLILNYNLILNLRFLSSSYAANISSFFPNRNQFGLFMLIEIILLYLLYLHKPQKKYIFYFLIFCINLFLSMSRNSILGLGVFILMIVYYKYVKYKIKLTKKNLFIIFLFLLILPIICLKILENERIINLINTLIIRADTLESGSGRFDVWKNGINIGMNYNLLFGVGRYKAIELNNILFGNKLEYFHSLYVERFASYGLFGFLILIILLKKVWKNINQCLDFNRSIILKSSLISFYIFSIFETTTRFSIGYADTIFLIFFFSFPILVSNIKK